jgi:hypothetical protein
MTDEELEGLAATLQLLLGDKHSEEKREVIYKAFPEDMAIFLFEKETYGEMTAGLLSLLRSNRTIINDLRQRCDGQSPLGRIAQEQARVLLSDLNNHNHKLSRMLGLRF